MIAENEVREKLGRYLSKEISLDQFEDWLAQRSWNMHLDSDAPAQRLVSAVELRLAEYSSGHLEESGLRDQLRPFVSSYTVHVWWPGTTEVPLLEQSPNNRILELSSLPLGAFQVAIPDQVAAPQVVTEFFDTELATARE
jgi:hypothetical protein